MIDIAVKYQTGIFGNFADIMPTPERMSRMISVFSDKGLLPGTFREISPSGGVSQLRLQMSSPNNEWNILIAAQRIDILKNAIDAKGENLGAIDEFTKEAGELVDRALKELDRKANRIALVTSGLLKDMPPDKLNTIFGRLFRPIGFYQENTPFEWNSRSVAKTKMNFGGFREDVNIITDINRVRANLQQQDSVLVLDRIEAAFDINTIQDNQENRFDNQSISEFFMEAADLRSQILSDLEVIINE
jgi:hypothetical protein